MSNKLRVHYGSSRGSVQCRRKSGREACPAMKWKASPEPEHCARRASNAVYLCGSVTDLYHAELTSALQRDARQALRSAPKEQSSADGQREEASENLQESMQ